MARHTVSEVAEILKIERETARGLVKFLSEVDLIVFKGERPATGRGKPEKVYEFTSGFDRALAAMLKRANLS